MVYPQGTVSGNFTKTIDVFDPKWQVVYDEACRKVCAANRNNTSLLGYYTDNEPFWSAPRLAKDDPARKTRKDEAFRWGIDKAAGPTLLQNFLALPPERPGHEAAWRWVLKRHGGKVADVAKAWGAGFNSREELQKMTGEKKLAIDSVAYGRDHNDFVGYYADEYFRITGTTIRKYDPNHLILGLRHAGRWNGYGRPMLASYARNRQYVDVCSINTYHYEMIDPIARYAEIVDDMPILIGETGWGFWLHGQWPAPPRTLQ